MASICYFCVERNNGLGWGGGQLCTTMYKWRAEQGLNATHLFCWHLCALHKPQIPSTWPHCSSCVWNALPVPIPHFALLTSILWASDSLLLLREVCMYSRIHLCSPKTVSSLLLCCLSQETIGFLKADSRPVSCTSALPGTVHATKQNVSEYLLNEAMNVSPFLVLPHNHNILI